MRKDERLLFGNKATLQFRYPKLDLHGLYVKEAEDSLEYFLQSWKKEKQKSEKTVNVVFMSSWTWYEDF